MRAHDVLAPLRLQVGAPVGASDPPEPIIVAVYVMVWPELLLDCDAETERVGSAFATARKRVGELAS